MLRRLYCFLRGLNVGGHTVGMDVLKSEFALLGYGNVETFIASGNVIFDTVDEETTEEHEIRISAHLLAVLGYEVAAFLREEGELAAIAVLEPFPDVGPADNIHVGMTHDPIDVGVRKALSGLETSYDSFYVEGREFYWLTRGRVSDSEIPARRIESLIAQPQTMRNRRTISRMAEKYIALI